MSNEVPSTPATPDTPEHGTVSTPQAPSATEAASAQQVSPEAGTVSTPDAPAATTEASLPQVTAAVTEVPHAQAPAATEGTVPTEATSAGTTPTDATPAAGTAPAPDAPSTKALAQQDTPAAAPQIPLPPEAEEIDARIAAALVMVAHGIRRLSKLAGNIRFAFLQRDESRLVSERRNIRNGFQNGKSTPAELKFALQALLQKTERMAGSLLHTPRATDAAAPAASGTASPAAGAAGIDTTKTKAGDVEAASTEASAGTGGTDAISTEPSTEAAGVAATAPTAGTPAPALPRERSNQIRQMLRKSMMSLAPAAPLHLQIELAHTFSEVDPDIMAMAARVHALHRQVLGSLKSILWHTPVHATLGFDDSRSLDVHFGETGAQDIPEEFRQKQPPQQPAGNRQGKDAGRGSRRADGRHGGKGGGARQPGQGRHHRPGGAAPASGAQGEAATGARNATAGNEDTRHAARPQDGKRPHGRNSNAGQGGKPGLRRGRPPHDDHAAADGQAPAGGQSQARGSRHGGEGRPNRERHRHGEGRPADRRHPEGRREGERRGAPGGGRPGGFPGNSAMADKLRAALGNSFGLGSKANRNRDADKGRTPDGKGENRDEKS